MNFCCGSFSSIMDRNNERTKLGRKFSNKENHMPEYSFSSNSCTPIMTNENLNFDFSTSPDFSMSLCRVDNLNCEENVERYLLSLNQEFLSFGLPQIFVNATSDADIKIIVLNSWKIIQMLRQNNKTRYSLELKQNKSESELKHMIQLIENLRNEVASKDRDLKHLRMNFSMLETKNNEINKLLKVEKDEVKKLNSIMGHRDAQFKNDSRKKEIEITKLKERLTQKFTIMKPAFELSSQLNRKNLPCINVNHDIQCGYEQKIESLNNENLTLRKMISSICKTVDLKITNEISISGENEKCHYIPNNIDDVLKMPIDVVKNFIEENFEKSFSVLILNTNKCNEISSNKKLNETFTLNEVEDDAVSNDDFQQLQCNLNKFQSLCEEQKMLIENLIEINSADVSFLKETDHLDNNIIGLPEQKPSNELAIFNKAERFKREKIEIGKMVQDFYDITPFRNDKDISKKHLSSSLISLQMTPSSRKDFEEMNGSTSSMININCQIPSSFDLYKTLNCINSPGFISCTLTASSKSLSTSMENRRASTLSDIQESSNSQTYDSFKLCAKLF